MKKIGLIAIIIVLSLGIIGVGYAAWSQNINITSTVSVGSYIINIAQSPAATLSNTNGFSGTFSAPGSLSDSSTTATATLSAVTTTGASAGFSITITKGYPGLTLKIPYIITNTGSVPSLISAVKLSTKGGTMAAWDGSLTNIVYGTATDVTVQNTTDGSTTLDLTSIANKNLVATSGTRSGILVVTIPNALTGQTDAGGLNVAASQTFNFEIDTVQNP
jgi:hypothetical protein